MRIHLKLYWSLRVLPVLENLELVCEKWSAGEPPPDVALLPEVSATDTLDENGDLDVDGAADDLPENALDDAAMFDDVPDDVQARRRVQAPVLPFAGTLPDAVPLEEIVQADYLLPSRRRTPESKYASLAQPFLQRVLPEPTGDPMPLPGFRSNLSRFDEELTLRAGTVEEFFKRLDADDAELDQRLNPAMLQQHLRSQPELRVAVSFFETLPQPQPSHRSQ